MSKPFVKKRSLIHSFRYAFHGLSYAAISQRNIWIHSILAIMVTILGVYFHISKTEWMALSFSISLVITTELINTAIELSVDLTTKRKKYRAMLSKDVAAAAVLLTSINAIIIGYLIFYHRFATLFAGGF